MESNETYFELNSTRSLQQEQETLTFHYVVEQLAMLHIM